MKLVEFLVGKKKSQSNDKDQKVLRAEKRADEIRLKSLQMEVEVYQTRGNEYNR